MTPEALDKIQNVLKESGLLEQILRRELISDLTGFSVFVVLIIVSLLLVKRFRRIEDAEERTVLVVAAYVFCGFMMLGVAVMSVDLISIYTSPLATAAKFLLHK